MRIQMIAAVVMVAMGAVAGPMMTPWGEKVTPENAWRGYPRPQMVRANWTNLNGDWDYAITAITNTAARLGYAKGAAAGVCGSLGLLL